MRRLALILAVVVAGCSSTPPQRVAPAPTASAAPLPGGLPQQSYSPIAARPAQCVQPSSKVGDIRPARGARPSWTRVSTLPDANIVGDFDVARDGAVWMQTWWLNEQEPQIRRWYAGRWERFTRPSVAVDRIGRLAAISADQVHLIGTTSNSVAEIHQTGKSRMLVSTLQNGRWRDMVVADPATRGLEAEASFVARGTWAFVGDPIAMRWDGRGWTTHRLPGETQVVALGGEGDDIWALRADQDDAGTRPVLLRWEGRGWRPIELPALGGPALGSSPTPLLGDVAVNGPADVWATGYVGWDENNEEYADEPLRARLFVLHWDGTSWTCSWGPMSWTIGDAEPDGKGGLWVTAGPEHRPEELWHLSAGRWTEERLPAPPGRLALVTKLVKMPGTARLYAAGYVGLRDDPGFGIARTQHATLWTTGE
ncbi:hypothetical protein [Nonomuraea sp. NPDC050691]|uniref:hypothetical protein n=1 Tax=Nonomuraea sp. NPDC050691 TaxID=3155661 RepID=UPI0034098F8E